MKTQEVKKKFLEAFEKNGHKIEPSSSSIPYQDPTLLFVNAGMNQFKDYFLGNIEPSYTKVTTAQKCIRVGGKHNDLDNVGHTKSHLTFFEMLGNFSFGDYFKKDAIAMAFDVAVNQLGVDIEKLFVTVYEKDLEAFELWKPYVAENKISFMGAADNYWSMGDTGPCGPCSELYFDKGEKYGNFTSPKEDPEGLRFVEFWNLVFMQDSKHSDGSKSTLPKQSIDTGMGLERMSALLSGKDNVFETNIFTSLIDRLSSFTNVKYIDNKAAFHVISDHLRCLSFAIADGAVPANVERGYVLRKVLRRAVRYARQLSINKPFMKELVPVLINEMGECYPELLKSKSKIEELLTVEEESFHKTLSRGGNILQSIIEKAKVTDKKEISGKDAFTLKDTYGFPLEEICLLAKDNHLDVHLESYSLLEKEAKEKSKKAHKVHKQEYSSDFFRDFVKKHGETVFCGAESLENQGAVTGIIHNGEFVDKLEKGQRGSVILDTTSFYAEMGGQTGDLGSLAHKKMVFTVEDCTSPYDGVSIHEGVVEEGTLIRGEPLTAKVCPSNRRAVENNHTATHMLHYALEKVLGDHIKQAGSLVSEDGLRLDFSHHKKIEKSELDKVEKMINEAIFKGFDVVIKEMSYKDIANNTSVKQLFGEKYGDIVRVVSVGDFSKELCGGTHVKNTSQIGLFKIIKESSISSGTRRIEACTHNGALKFLESKEQMISDICKTLQTPESKLLGAAEKIASEHKDLKKKHKKMQKEYLCVLTKQLSTEKESIGDAFFLIKEVSLEKDAFAALGTDLLSSIKNGIVILANTCGNDCQILIQKTKSANALPSAKLLLDEIMQKLDGRGGGSDFRAQGSGKNAANITDALEFAKNLLEQSLL